MVRVLFVCLGNICRSPTAEGVFRKLVEQEGLLELIEIDSAGTHAYHIGEAPDARAQQAAARRGIDLSQLRGRKATASDIEAFDYVLAMDRDNYENLLAISPDHLSSRVRLFLEYASNRPEDEVPDPYFGGSGGFERVLDMVEEAAEGLLADIRRQHDF
ncbi:MAG: low molecular weight phosphotyrosine protein phosphatase [Acidiferrobacterales bacterium]|jgi:protein-tyrosine phosphatase|nr:low molecular weight phosphotyrosine protein phosphatase [Acidiferrobacterales bacterium]